MNRILTIMLLAVACATTAALTVPPTSHARVLSACEVSADAPRIVNGVVSGPAQLQCLSVTSGLVLTACLQRYNPATGSWVELSNSCRRQPPLGGTLTDDSIEVAAAILCNPYASAVDYRTRAHGVWSSGGSGDDFSATGSLNCY